MKSGRLAGSRFFFALKGLVMVLVPGIAQWVRWGLLVALLGFGNPELRAEERRPFPPVEQAVWRGNGISYGPYRDGQRPGGGEPTQAQIAEDLELLVADGWQMIRLYGTEPFARKTCELVRDKKLPISIMVGAWVATEQDNDDQRVSNLGQVERAIELANEFPEVVCAVCVSNESQVSWSFHKVQPATLIGYIQKTRSAVKQPVTVADDFMYWTTPESRAVAAEIDFIVTHCYALWHGRPLSEALAFTKEKFAAVRKQHPDHLIVLGECGWATDKPVIGEQAERVKGAVGEPEQAEFLKVYLDWVRSHRIPYFYFEAFDENWKGGETPRDVEKPWGLFRADRSRKQAIADGSPLRKN